MEDFERAIGSSEQFDDLIDWVNGLDAWAQWTVGLFLTILTWASIRLVMRKVVLDFVRQTSIDWDDQLYGMVTKRLYLFILIVGVNMTMVWVVQHGSEIKKKAWA